MIKANKAGSLLFKFGLSDPDPDHYLQESELAKSLLQVLVLINNQFYSANGLIVVQWLKTFR